MRPGRARAFTRVHAQSLEALTGYDWPGNVRQLENTIERAVALETASELRVELPAERPKARAVAAGAETAFAASLTANLPAGSVLPEGVNMENYVEQIERGLLQSALSQTNGVQSPRRRRTRDLLPLVSPPDEEVRVVGRSSQLSALSSQLFSLRQ